MISCGSDVGGPISRRCYAPVIPPDQRTTTLREVLDALSMSAGLLPNFAGNVAASVNDADHLDSCRGGSVEDVVPFDDETTN